jgi:hypothetical protein
MENSKILVAMAAFLVLLAGLVLAVSPSERQQLNNFKVSTLKGLSGVAVTVKIVREKDETLSLLQENDLKREAELALQAGGVEVLPPKPDVGLYVVIVKVAGGGPDSVNVAINVQSMLLQIVNLTRDSSIKTEAQTWPAPSQSRFGLMDIALAKSMITRTVKEQVKDFADDYKAANPKPSTAETAEKK